MGSSHGLFVFDPLLREFVMTFSKQCRKTFKPLRAVFLSRLGGRLPDLKKPESCVFIPLPLPLPPGGGEMQGGSFPFDGGGWAGVKSSKIHLASGGFDQVGGLVIRPPTTLFIEGRIEP
jgi:hypothetical protein